MDATLRDDYISTHFAKLNRTPGPEVTRFYEMQLRDVLPHDLDAAILEIGVGMGHMAYYLTNVKGYRNYLGVDISRDCVESVRTQVGARAERIDDTAEWLEERPGSFRLIVMFDVIEHIAKSEHMRMLAALRSALAVDGVLVLRTDNMAGFSGLYQARMDFTHEYTYVEPSLEQVLTATGFTHVELRGDRPLVTGVRSAAYWLAAVLWRQVLRVIYEIERPYCRNPRIFTKNLYAVCRK